MTYVIYTGKNASLRLYSIRFVPNKSVLVENAEVVERLKLRPDFTIKEVEAASVSSGSASTPENTEPTLNELKEQAKAAGIKGYSQMNKPELIQALKEKEVGSVSDGKGEGNDPDSDDPPIS